MEQSDARNRVEAESTALGDSRTALQRHLSRLRGRVVFVCPQLLRQLPPSLLLFLGPC